MIFCFLLWKLRTQGRHHHEQSTPVLSLLLIPLGKRTCSNWLVWAESKNAGRITGRRTTKNPAVLLLSVVIKKGEHATSVLLMCPRCESHLLYYRQEGKACSPVCVPMSVCVCVCKGGGVKKKRGTAESWLSLCPVTRHKPPNTIITLTPIF